MQLFQQDASTSKLQTSHKPKRKTKQNIQSDQLQRAAVLGPPGAPQRGESQEVKDDRLKKLEQKLDDLALMLDMLKTQVPKI